MTSHAPYTQANAARKKANAARAAERKKQQQALKQQQQHAKQASRPASVLKLPCAYPAQLSFATCGACATSAQHARRLIGPPPPSPLPFFADKAPPVSPVFGLVFL